MNGRGVAITDWAAVSPFGIGRDAFANGIREAKGTAAALDPERWPTAEDRACLVPGFEVREVLGNAGTRTMDRFTGLAVAAIGDLLRRWAGDPDTGDRAETGLVLGTTMGSAQSTMDFVRPSFTAIAPFFVDPAQMPNAVMNCAAARSAIWHRLTGPNATVAGGHSAGLHALGYARRLMRYGHAAHVVCGAVEEYSAARSWLEHHTRDGARAAAAPGEGCAVLMLEEPGAEAPLADVLDVVSEACLDEDFGRAVRTCLRELLDRSGARAEEVWAASVSDAPGPAGEQERDAVRELFGDGPVERVPVAGLIGDTAAASGAFQIAAVLAVAEEDTGAAGRLAAISSVDGDGTVSAALLRLRGARVLTGRACAVLAEPVVVGRAVAENGVWRGTAAVPIAAEEPVFAGHFEDFPIFPGMCVLECAHRGALAIAPAEFGDGRLTAIESARFTAPVYPGDTLTVEVEWRDAGERWYCAAGARVAAREVAVLRLAYLPGGAP